MGDTRTDSGQYYPGGKVVSQHGVAPPQIIVQWSDVQGKPQIAPLPDRYREDDMKGKINEIASKFATVVLAALVGWTACADITVQKKRKDQIYNDEQVVVDVTGSGVGVDTNAVRDIAREEIAPATNAVNVAMTNRYTKAETDEMLAGKLDSYEFEYGGNTVVGAEFSESAKDSRHAEKANDFDRDGIIAARFDWTASKVEDGVGGNLASLTADGDLADSGIAKTNVATKAEVGTKLSLTNGENDASIVWGRNPENEKPRLEVDAELWTTEEIYVYGNLEVYETGHFAGSVDIADELTVGGVNFEDKADRSELPVISATDTIFSNAVMSVATGISTNDWAVIASVADWASVIPGGVPTGAGTLGAVLAALAATVLALKKKTSLLKNDGTADDEFATELLGKQVAKAAIVKECLYDEYTVPTTGDDAYDLHANASNLLVFNSSQTSYTFDLSAHLPQKVNGKLMDFFIELNTDAPVTVSTNAADTAKIRGDSPSVSEAGNYWITFSTKADGTIYIRNIKMEAPQS